MSLPQSIQKEVEQTNWYMQGCSASLYFVSSPYRGALSYYGGFNYFKGKVNYGYFNRDREKKFADKMLTAQSKDRNYLKQKYIAPWQQLIKEHNELNEVIVKTDWSKVTDKKFLSFYKKYDRLQTRFWAIGIYIEVFDPWGDALLKEQKIPVPEHELNVLIGPRKLTYVQCEERDRLEIALAYKNGKDVSAMIEAHSKKYFWLNNSWAEAMYLGPDYFSEIIKNDSKQPSEKIQKRIDDIDDWENTIAQQIALIWKKYKLTTSQKNIIHFFSQMTDWRDERKLQVLKTNYYNNILLQELSRRTGISLDSLHFIESSEVADLSMVKKHKKTLEKRAQEVIYEYKNKKLIWHVGKDAAEIREALDKQLSDSDEIKGTIACKGKSTGKVKVIITLADFAKMEEGDILVTSMTRPEYMPVIVKAAALVTDEGGITCHAAIVARELKKPCIIGTQVATKILKDGDLVEVDAENGVVKIL